MYIAQLIIEGLPPTTTWAHCYLSTSEGDSQSHPWLHDEFETCLQSNKTCCYSSQCESENYCVCMCACSHIHAYVHAFGNKYMVNNSQNKIIRIWVSLSLLLLSWYSWWKGRLWKGTGLLNDYLPVVTDTLLLLLLLFLLLYIFKYVWVLFLQLSLTHVQRALELLELELQTPITVTVTAGNYLGSLQNHQML